jgi:hypothetical protein
MVKIIFNKRCSTCKEKIICRVKRPLWLKLIPYSKMQYCSDCNKYFILIRLYK